MLQQRSDHHLPRRDIQRVSILLLLTGGGNFSFSCFYFRFLNAPVVANDCFQLLFSVSAFCSLAVTWIFLLWDGFRIKQSTDVKCHKHQLHIKRFNDGCGGHRWWVPLRFDSHYFPKWFREPWCPRGFVRVLRSAFSFPRYSSVFRYCEREAFFSALMPAGSQHRRKRYFKPHPGRMKSLLNAASLLQMSPCKHILSYCQSILYTFYM